MSWMVCLVFASVWFNALKSMLVTPGSTLCDHILQLTNQTVQIVGQSLQFHLLNRVVSVLDEGLQFGVAAPQIGQQGIGIRA